MECKFASSSTAILAISSFILTIWNVNNARARQVQDDAGNVLY
ncbi:exported hypothetical protein [Clostridioides difficile E19]|nr:exported hypothetical protein [Clostridioides difficile E19]